jgi:1-acyl-sn-glycerol-3-phosphate acyltransferase
MGTMDLLGSLGQLAGAVGRVSGGLGDWTASPELLARIDRVQTALGPEGIDPFGFDPAYVRRFIGAGAWAYRRYFRCETTGTEHLPAGRCILVANHSGQLPYDGMMIALAAFLEGEPPRAVRSMVDRFVPNTPFVSPMLARLGQVLGTPSNGRRLLQDEQAILVFPEGQPGLNKLWRQRYQLQRFGHGFLRLALETRAPIVPVALVGAEEQAPSFGNLRPLAQLLGLPALPLTPAPLFGLVPLPTRYRIHFGAPIEVHGDAHDDDAAIARQVRTVKLRLQAMLNEALAARPHVFT